MASLRTLLLTVSILAHGDPPRVSAEGVPALSTMTDVVTEWAGAAVEDEHDRAVQ